MTRSRSPSGSLIRQVLLDAALAVIDRSGIDGLTIRGLASEVRRPPMTLYAHFDSKHELLDLAFDRLLNRLFVGERHFTWQAQYEATCRHMRETLLEHPHWMGLLTRMHITPSSLEMYDRLLGLMRKDGFTPEAAVLALSSIVSHAIGSVLVQRMLGGKPSIPKRRLELVKEMLAGAPRSAYPRVASVSAKFDRWSFDGVFEIGLRALIVGLEQRASRRGSHRRYARPRTSTAPRGTSAA
jgi:AcrR family transcriptional regulator